MNRRNFWSAWARMGVAALALSVGLGGQVARADEQDVPSPLKSFAISAPSRDPVALVLQGPDGQTLPLDSYRGKPFLLHVWATWCGPCKQELPKLNAFLQQHPDAPVVPAAIASGDVTKVASFLTQAQDQSVHAWVVDKAAFRVWFHAPSQAIPVTILIDGQGHVRSVNEGSVDWGAADAAEQLKAVLAQAGGQ